MTVCFGKELVGGTIVRLNIDRREHVGAADFVKYITLLTLMHFMHQRQDGTFSVRRECESRIESPTNFSHSMTEIPYAAVQSIPTVRFMPVGLRLSESLVLAFLTRYGYTSRGRE